MIPELTKRSITQQGKKWQNTKSGGAKKVFPSLIEAYAAGFAGYMTIRDMASCLPKGSLTILNFAEENVTSTLRIVRDRWMRGYLHACDEKSFKDEYYISDTIRALRKLLASLEPPSEKYSEIRGSLIEAISQFRALLKRPSRFWKRGKKKM